MEDKIYLTVLGDTWDSIAYKLFNNSKSYNILLELNPEFHGVLIFTSGIKIKYQDITITNENIAPWRRK